MVAAAWKSGVSSVECVDGGVVLADHNSPPAISAALLDSVKSFCKTARRADVGRWCSMYAVTGSDSKASTSVDVAGRILDAEVERVTWTGRRGFEGNGDWAGACFVVFVDILETWSGDVRKCGVRLKLETLNVLTPSWRIRDGVRICDICRDPRTVNPLVGLLVRETVGRFVRCC
jgi:hypothetical protein